VSLVRGAKEVLMAAIVSGLFHALGAASGRVGAGVPVRGTGRRPVQGFRATTS